MTQIKDKSNQEEQKGEDGFVNRANDWKMSVQRATLLPTINGYNELD